MPSLTSKQRAHLRGLAHGLRPVLHIGKEGVTDASAHALADALRTRELLKIRILDAAPEDARTTAHALAGRLSEVHVVQVVGHTAVLYRADPDHPTIHLPR
ncbi:MAG: ribosome assembly RNA-binding protein YhbY [Bacteroidota bacterium]